MTRVTLVYPNPRAALIEEARAGTAPATTLLALDQLPAHGFDVAVRDSGLDTRFPSIPKRVRWHLRELTLPFELEATDVIFTPLANLIPITAGLRRVPVVVFNFGLNTVLRRATRARREALAASLRRASAVVSLAASQRDELIELAGLDHARNHVVLHGVDHRFFAPRETPRERFVLAVGRDLARDYETLATAARALDCRVVIVTAKSRNLAGVDLPANVDVHEGLSWAALRDLYARAGCAVVPLRPQSYPYGSEASGVTALLEAEATATPIVATERPVVREYVTHGESALLVPGNDPPALREALERLLDDPELANAYGRAGRRRVVGRHTMDDMAASLAPILHGAGEGRRAL